MEEKVEDKINQAALDFIKTSAMESDIELTESDIDLIKWGIIAGSWATLKHINDENEAQAQKRRSWKMRSRGTGK